MNQAPLIYEVRNRKTVFVDRRRLLLPDHFESGTPYDLSQESALPQGPRRKDNLKSLLFSFELLDEARINNVCSHFTWLAPVKNVILKTLFLVCINLSAIVYLVIWSRQPQTIPAPAHAGSLISIKVLLIFLGQVAIMFAHELAHCAAARQMGVRIDSLGAGVYLFLPALYCKISLIALLNRNERIIVLWSGLLLQLTISPLIFVLYLYTKSDVIISLFYLNIFMILINMIPIARLDGYRIVVEFLNSPTAPALIKRVAPPIIKGIDVMTVILVLYLLASFIISSYFAIKDGTLLQNMHLILTLCIVIVFMGQFIYRKVFHVRRS